MKVIGKLSVSLATVLSGSCISYLALNQTEWFKSNVCKYTNIKLPDREKLQSVIPTGSRVLGFFVAQFPKQILNLTQSEHFIIRDLSQKILSSASLPKGFSFTPFLRDVPDRTLTNLARNSLVDVTANTNSKVVEKSEKELSDSFRHLLSALPTSGQCAAWFTQSAFHGGKSGHYLYKTIFWHPEDGDHLETLSSTDEIILFLKALRKHSELQTHRSLILENNGLELLRSVSTHYTDVKITQLVSHVLGNLAVDETSHSQIIEKGWLREMQMWNMKSEDMVVRSQSGRALANLDRDGEKGHTYEDGIFVVYPVKQLKCCRPEVDLVFVHGLRGSPFRTWRSRSDKVVERKQTNCWPKEWFPVDIPSCRVILVEYDTELSGWTSKCPMQPEISTIEYRSSELLNKLKNAGVGRRPIVWFAHSLGGLMVKQMLLDATKSPEFCSLYLNTKGVVFYAVPHKGSDIASMVSGKALKYLFLPSFEVKALQKGSEYLEDLQKNFVDFIQANKIDVLSFAETQPATGIVRDTLIVSSDSADLGVGDFVSLSANHYEVCKPCSPLDPSYTKTVHFVRQHLDMGDPEEFMLVLLF